MQAIFGGIFFLGQGLGALVGGPLYDSVGGWLAYRYFGLANLVYAGVFLALVQVLAHTRRRQAGHEGPGENTSEDPRPPPPYEPSHPAEVTRPPQQAQL